MASSVANVIRRKMVIPPNLRPKTKYGQRTVRAENGSDVQYERLKGEYVNGKMEPLIRFLRGRMVQDGEIREAPEGVYTWILKKSHLYASRLLTNQEIGTLHVDLNMMTLEEEDVVNGNQGKGIHSRTLKNLRNASAKPVAAGEFLLVRRGVREQGDEKEQEQGVDEVHLYFNLQSGTYSEQILRCLVAKKAEEQGIVLVKRKPVPDALKQQCREMMMEETRSGMSHATGIPVERIHFLSCDSEMQEVLEQVPFLAGRYEHGACREEDDYMEHTAGRNLIRRYRAMTSAENGAMLNTYFSTGLPPAPAPPSMLGKRKTNKNRNKNKNKNNQNTKRRKVPTLP
jgi:hypothetical protein